MISFHPSTFRMGVAPRVAEERVWCGVGSTMSGFLSQDLTSTFYFVTVWFCLNVSQFQPRAYTMSPVGGEGVAFGS